MIKLGQYLLLFLILSFFLVQFVVDKTAVHAACTNTGTTGSSCLGNDKCMVEGGTAVYIPACPEGDYVEAPFCSGCGSSQEARDCACGGGEAGPCNGGNPTCNLGSCSGCSRTFNCGICGDDSNCCSSNGCPWENGSCKNNEIVCISHCDWNKDPTSCANEGCTWTPATGDNTICSGACSGGSCTSQCGCPLNCTVCVPATPVCPANPIFPANPSTMSTTQVALNANAANWGTGCPSQNNRVSYQVFTAADTAFITNLAPGNCFQMPAGNGCLVTSNLAYGTTYKWRVVLNNGSNAVTCNPWTFEVRSQPGWWQAVGGGDIYGVVIRSQIPASVPAERRFIILN